MQYLKDTPSMSSPTNLSLVKIWRASKNRCWCSALNTSLTKLLPGTVLPLTRFDSDGQLKNLFRYWMFDCFMSPDASTMQIASCRKSVKFDIGVTSESLRVHSLAT